VPLGLCEGKPVDLLVLPHCLDLRERVIAGGELERCACTWPREFHSSPFALGQFGQVWY
jgi:hypothetical protein